MKESDHFGYTRVGIGTNKYQVHRLVAIAFIPNPENKPSVNHINRDCKDNKLENLRWATSKEHSANQTITNGGCYKKINRIDLKTHEIKEYKDIHEVIEYILSTTKENDKRSIENKIRACCTNRKENAYVQRSN